MKAGLMKFWKEEDGATAIEYGLIAGLIAIGIIAALTSLGGNLSTFFNDVGDRLPDVKVAATTPDVDVD